MYDRSQASALATKVIIQTAQTKITHTANEATEKTRDFALNAGRKIQTVAGESAQ